MYIMETKTAAKNTLIWTMADRIAEATEKNVLRTKKR